MATDIYPDERLALIATIIERHPADAPRRVFADWLEERGERTWDTMLGFVLADKRADWPRLMAADWLERDGQRDRAEFIRLQIELARMDAAGVYTGVRPCCQDLIDGLRIRSTVAIATRHAMQRRTEVLGSGTVGEFQRRFFPDSLANRRFIPHPTWRCGFVEAIRWSWADCTKHLDALLREQPITRVELTDFRIEFGTIQFSQRHDQRRRRYVLRAECDVAVGGEPRQPWDTQLDISELDVMASRNLLAYKAAEFREGVRRSATAHGYLQGRWPGIEFKLPPVPVINAPHDVAAYIEALRQHNVGSPQSRPTAPPTVLLSGDITLGTSEIQ